MLDDALDLISDDVTYTPLTAVNEPNENTAMMLSAARNIPNENVNAVNATSSNDPDFWDDFDFGAFQTAFQTAFQAATAYRPPPKGPME